MREVEAKFRVHGPFTLPDLTGDDTGVAEVSAGEKSSLRATYYDTADLRLAREGITLRQRAGGSDAGWHLKLPTGSDRAREEIQLPPDGSGVPAALRELVTAYVRSASLAPVATLRTARTTRVLYDGSGNRLGELVDDVVSVLDGPRVAARFREIEVEAAPDAEDQESLLDRVGATLAAAGAQPGEVLPKAVRALGARASAPPDPAPPAKVTPADSARAALVAHLTTNVRAFLAQDSRVRRDEPDSVHQMRVAARRLRSALRTFGPLVETAWADALREELAWVADVLGGARDGEVLLARLLGDLATLPAEVVLGPVADRLESRLSGGLAEAREQVLEVLRGERYLALLEQLVAAATNPPTTSAAAAPAGVVLPKLVGAAFDELARRARRLDRPGTPDEAFHRARITAKRARYAAEACVPVFGCAAKALAVEIARVQEVLGEHQDAVVAADFLRDLAAEPRRGDRTGFTLGVLFADQRAAAHTARAAFADIWPDVRRPRHRRWLAGAKR
ncbi:MAG: CHAD domain-containing protein [Mycobacteriales bacterium]